MTDDPIETLMVDVRASTRGFASDIRTMRAQFDSTLVDGFSRAGSVLERGLLAAIRRGGLGFDDLKRIALRTMEDIAAQAMRAGPGSGGLFDGLLAGAASAILGLPGRATGGPVSPERPYLVGEGGPEVFVPASAGRVERATGGGEGRPREVRVAIQLAAPRGSSAPASLRRSARQVASTVRRALREN